jgi:endonuclease/exonuclease/phosphatase family metal-dependent hydrolase
LAFAVFLVVGFHIPWRAAFSSYKPAASLRIMTYNVHGHAARADSLAKYIDEIKPDIVVLQEWAPPCNPPTFATGWTVVTDGEMCLASRYPVEPCGEIENSATVRYIVNTPLGNINVFNAHFASPHFPLRDTILGSKNGRADLEANIAIRTRESRLVSAAARAVDGPVIVAGDFNLPPDSPIFRDHFSDFADAFDQCGLGFGVTYFNGWTASRIDHILTTGPLTCRACWLGQNVGSPHRPLIADFSTGNMILPRTDTGDAASPHKPGSN